MSSVRFKRAWPTALALILGCIIAVAGQQLFSGLGDANQRADVAKKRADVAQVRANVAQVRADVAAVSATFVRRVELINCHSIEALKTAIRASIQISLASLGHKGAAFYGYYSIHPQELSAARSQSISALNEFRPRRCS